MNMEIIMTFKDGEVIVWNQGVAPKIFTVTDREQFLHMMGNLWNLHATRLARAEG